MIKSMYQYMFLLGLILLSSGVNAQQKNPASSAPHGGFSSTQFLVLMLGSRKNRSFVKKYLQKRKITTKTLEVTATAYTSHVGQTDSTPNIAAWGDRLRPGMKVIAVSRDLLTRYKLKRGSLVRIKGLSGQYRVLDKMNRRWRKKIDIYMGKNKKKAFRWGKKKVVIQWRA